MIPYGPPLPSASATDNAPQAEHAEKFHVDQIRHSPNSSKVEFHFPDFYVIELWGYCEGRRECNNIFQVL